MTAFSPDRPGPLAGIRVLDLATFIAAPYTAAILGEFGAEVIKVEQPAGGDTFRRFGTPTTREDSTLAWLSESRNKKSVTLDLRKPEGVTLFERLVEVSDVICENFRPGTLEKWGIGWDALKGLKPGLVMLRVSGYGQTGPYSDRPGFARIAHAFGGLTYLAGMPGEMPVTPGSTSLGDYMSGLYGAVGVLLALRYRDATGVGQVIDIGLYESVFRVLDEIAPAYAATGHVREPEGIGTLMACPHGHFRTGDGKWLAIACSNDRMFKRLCRAMGGAGELFAIDYAEQRARLADRDTVNRAVADWIASMDRERVMEICLEHQVPAGPVNSIADIFSDPHFRARGNLLVVDEPDIGEVVIPAPVPRLSETPGKVLSLGPGLGQDNEGIYGGLLGLSADKLAQLKREDVI